MTSRFVPIACVCVFAFVSRVEAQRPDPRVALLLSAEAVEKLKLTVEQNEKYTRLETEFKDKNKDTLARIKADAQGDRAKAREAMQKFQTDSRKAREDYLTKVEAFLTAEQKTTFMAFR